MFLISPNSPGKRKTGRLYCDSVSCGWLRRNQNQTTTQDKTLWYNFVRNNKSVAGVWQACVMKLGILLVLLLINEPPGRKRPTLSLVCRSSSPPPDHLEAPCHLISPRQPIHPTTSLPLPALFPLMSPRINPSSSHLHTFILPHYLLFILLPSSYTHST